MANDCAEVEAPLQRIMLLNESEMNLRAREHFYQEDMPKAYLEMDEAIHCSLGVLNETCLLVGLSKAACFGERREHMMVDMLEAQAGKLCSRLRSKMINREIRVYEATWFSSLPRDQ
jgi:hypothetical protein